ncbi:MAG TPA: DEAD/DEAH box helicase, partial [Clostridia bacterium]|nr:DEAD/DEAH box helicase [Clostridia bacterium]
KSKGNTMNFETLGLRTELIAGLNKQGITETIGIQDKMFSGILAGENIIACSQTGSGKTLGYLLPIFQRQEIIQNGLQVVILVSTHELGLQVHRQIELLAANSGIPLRSASVFGNANIDLQIKALKTKPQIVVGTPGRVLDLMQKKHIPAHLAKTIIVDEGDFLFNRNNTEVVSAIIKKALRDTQLVVVSASISKYAKATVEAMGKHPNMILEAEKARIPSSITHLSVACEEREKPECLRKLMSALEPTKAIAIINNRNLLEIVAAKLKYHKVCADYIHGESTRQDRKRVMGAFKNGELKLLLATDLAARGLDFEDIDVVFSVTASEDTSDYLHKAGRTGRCGKEGMCVSLVSSKETPMYQACEKQFGIQIHRKYLREGKLIDPK